MKMHLQELEDVLAHKQMAVFPWTNTATCKWTLWKEPNFKNYLYLETRNNKKLHFFMKPLSDQMQYASTHRRVAASNCWWSQKACIKYNSNWLGKLSDPLPTYTGESNYEKEYLRGSIVSFPPLNFLKTNIVHHHVH